MFSITLSNQKVPASQKLKTLKPLPKTKMLMIRLNIDLKNKSRIQSAKSEYNRFIANLKNVGQHQHACLRRTQIQAAFMQVHKTNKQLNRSKCIVNLDFSKAFGKNRQGLIVRSFRLVFKKYKACQKDLYTSISVAKSLKQLCYNVDPSNAVFQLYFSNSLFSY